VTPPGLKLLTVAGVFDDSVPSPATSYWETVLPPTFAT